MSTNLDAGIYAMYDNAKQTNELLGAITGTTASTGKTVQEHANYNRDASDRAVLGLRNAIEGNSIATNLNINRTSDQLQRDAQANNIANLLSVERNGSNIIGEIKQTAGSLGTSVERNAGELNTAIARNSGENKTLLANSASALSTQAERIGGEIRLSNALNHASVVENFKESLVQQAGQSEKIRYSNLEQQAVTGREIQNQTVFMVDKLDKVKEYITKEGNSSQLNANLLNNAVNGTKFELSKQAGDYFAKHQMDLVKVENSLGRQSDIQFANINQRMGDYSAKTCLEIAKSEASLSKQSALETASVQLEAMKNHLTMQKQLSDCCCELKELVVEKNTKTDDLINTINSDHYRDNLIEAREASLLLALNRNGHNGGHNGGHHGGHHERPIIIDHHHDRRRRGGR